MRTPDGVHLPENPYLVAGTDSWRHAGLVGAGFLVLTVLVYLYGAPMALGGLLVLLVGGMLLHRPQVATALVVLLLYINFPAILVNRYGVPSPAAGAFLGLLVIPLMHGLFIQRQRLRTDGTLAWMLALLGIMLASSMVAVDRGIALELVTTYVLEGVILYWLVINAIRSRDALRRVLWVLVGMGAFLSSLSLYQEVTGSYEQEFGGLAHRNYIAAEAAGELREDRRRTWDRAQGPVNESNRFAQILIVLLPFAAYLHRCSRGERKGKWAAMLGLLVLSGVILTLSRGAFLALVVMGSSMLALRWLRASRLVIALAGLVLIVPLVTPFYSDRVQSIMGATSLFSDDSHRQQELDGAIRGRSTVMLAALNVFLDHPVIGVGPGQFSPFYVQDYAAELDVRYREIRTPRRAHTLYLEIAAETGIVGLGIFLGILLGLLRALWRERRRWLRLRPDLADLATAACLSVLAYAITAVFLHLSYQRYFWLLIGIAGATLHLIRREGRLEAERLAAAQLPSRRDDR